MTEQLNNPNNHVVNPSQPDRINTAQGLEPTVQSVVGETIDRIPVGQSQTIVPDAPTDTGSVGKCQIL